MKISHFMRQASYFIKTRVADITMARVWGDWSLCFAPPRAMIISATLISYEITRLFITHSYNALAQHVFEMIFSVQSPVLIFRAIPICLIYTKYCIVYLFDHWRRLCILEFCTVEARSICIEWNVIKFTLCNIYIFYILPDCYSIRGFSNATCIWKW